MQLHIMFTAGEYSFFLIYCFIRFFIFNGTNLNDIQKFVYGYKNRNFCVFYNIMHSHILHMPTFFLKITWTHKNKMQ